MTMAWWEIRLNGSNEDECTYESSADGRREAENFHRVALATAPALALYRWALAGGGSQLEVRYDAAEWWSPTGVTLDPVEEWADVPRRKRFRRAPRRSVPVSHQRVRLVRPAVIVQ